MNNWAERKLMARQLQNFKQKKAAVKAAFFYKILLIFY